MKILVISIKKLIFIVSILNMVKQLKKKRVRSWQQLESISKVLWIDGKKELLIPEGVYGLPDTQVTLDADHEYEKNWQTGVMVERALQGTVLITGI